MSRRIAHRPRYRHMRQIVLPPQNTRQTFFRTRWRYRRQDLAYEKHPLGYGLSFIPFGYRLVQKMMLPSL